MPIRTAEAVWNGSLLQGWGSMKMKSGAFEGPYDFSSRFEEGAGTTPEELIAAAHAGCFSMQFAGLLTDAGFPPDRVYTLARVHIDKMDGGFAITGIELNSNATVPSIDESTFQQIADTAKRTCPVSRALAGVEIRLQAKLQ